MKLAYALFAILAVSAEYATATDYCDVTLCQGVEHIACNNDGAWAKTCSQTTLIDLNQAQKDLIVNVHNKYRNAVAGGETDLNPACRMATMEWDEELAQLAELNVKKCELNHDACHNTDDFLYSGQNLAWFGYTGAINNSRLAEQSVDLWYNEIKDTTIEHIASYPNAHSGPTIGHFTIMVAEKNTRVGCAAATFVANGKSYNNFLFACNYATTNLINFPIYESCEDVASKCTTDSNPTYENLCSINESFDVNSWF